MLKIGDGLQFTAQGADPTLDQGHFWSILNHLYYRDQSTTYDLLNQTGLRFFYQDTPPASPNVGDLWGESDTGLLFEYVNDGTSYQWVEFGPLKNNSIGNFQLDFYSTPGTYTWTKPDNAKLIEAYIVGGGGGGGRGSVWPAGISLNSGCGGGGGAVVHITLPEFYLNSTETVVVGAAGVGGVSATLAGAIYYGDAGTDGGQSSFSDYIAYGGGGGSGGHNLPNKGGGGGGAASGGSGYLGGAFGGMDGTVTIDPGESIYSIGAPAGGSGTGGSGYPGRGWGGAQAGGAGGRGGDASQAPYPQWLGQSAYEWGKWNSPTVAGGSTYGVNGASLAANFAISFRGAGGGGGGGNYHGYLASAGAGGTGQTPGGGGGGGGSSTGPYPDYAYGGNGGKGAVVIISYF